MRFSTIIVSTFTAAAIVVAAPLEKRAVTTTWIVKVITETKTVYGTTPAATPSAIGAFQHHSRPHHHRSSHTTLPPAPKTTSTPPAPIPSTTSTEAQAPPPQPKPTANPPPAPVPAPVQPSPGSCGPYNPSPDFNAPPVSCGISVLDTINKWRKAYGKSELRWANNLAQAAWATLTFNGGGGNGMVHPGLVMNSFGETITPGYWDTATLNQQQRANTLSESPFEVALMGWLCEVKSDPQLQASGFTGKDQCGIVSGVSYISGSNNPNEPTGHHDIFLSDSYKSIGCGFMQSTQPSGQPQWSGQWTCDFGY